MYASTGRESATRNSIWLCLKRGPDWSSSLLLIKFKWCYSQRVACFQLSIALGIARPLERRRAGCFPRAKETPLLSQLLRSADVHTSSVTVKQRERLKKKDLKNYIRGFNGAFFSCRCLLIFYPRWRIIKWPYISAHSEGRGRTTHVFISAKRHPVFTREFDSGHKKEVAGRSEANRDVFVWKRWGTDQTPFSALTDFPYILF